MSLESDKQLSADVLDLTSEMKKMTASNRPYRCRFLELPPELRNRIYEYAVIEPKPIDMYSWRPVLSGRPPITSLSSATSWQRTSEPGLLSTCKAVRKETLALYYSGNIFDSYPNTPGTDWKGWLAGLSAENTSLLKHVRVYPEERGSHEQLARPRHAAKTLRSAYLWAHKNGIKLDQDVLFVRVMVDRKPRYAWSNKPLQDGVQDGDWVERDGVY